jgi:hypothetical protein
MYSHSVSSVAQAEDCSLCRRSFGRQIYATAQGLLAHTSLLHQLYDFLLMLPQEIAYVWQSPRYSYTTVLYICTRYIPLIDVLLVLHSRLRLRCIPPTVLTPTPDQLFLNASMNTCKITWPIAACKYLNCRVFVRADGFDMSRAIRV